MIRCLHSVHMQAGCCGIAICSNGEATCTDLHTRSGGVDSLQGQLRLQRDVAGVRRRAHPGIVSLGRPQTSGIRKWLSRPEAAASFLLKQREAMLAAERMDSKALGRQSAGPRSSTSTVWIEWLDEAWKAAKMLAVDDEIGQAAVQPALHRAVDTLPGAPLSFISFILKLLERSEQSCRS